MSSHSTSSSGEGEASDAMIELLSPDGYYTYLGIPKNAAPSEKKTNGDEKSPLTGEVSSIDEDLVKKNYRKLSLKHHPDKRGGDADTFRVLNRAQRVLMNPKSRQQYDILGIDLDDDEEDRNDNSENEEGEATSTAQGIVQEIAGMVLASLIQLGVRTVMMGAVAVILVRYRWTLYPTLAFLTYIAFHLFQRARAAGGSRFDVLSPILIATGLMLMYKGGEMIREDGKSTWVFWCGESLVIYMFTYNSITGLPGSPIIYGGIAIFSMIAALWFRGSVWNYGTIVLFEGLLAIFVALAFPVMELVLEAILNEKLRKVGDKVRTHHSVLEKYYRAKLGKQGNR